MARYGLTAHLFVLFLAVRDVPAVFMLLRRRRRVGRLARGAEDELVKEWDVEAVRRSRVRHGARAFVRKKTLFLWLLTTMPASG